MTKAPRLEEDLLRAAELGTEMAQAFDQKYVSLVTRILSSIFCCSVCVCGVCSVQLQQQTTSFSLGLICVGLGPCGTILGNG